MIDVARMFAEARKPMILQPEGGAVQTLYLPDGYKLVDMEQMYQTPYRKRGIIKLDTAVSLATYVNEHKLPNSTHTYTEADFEKQTARLIAVLNDHAGMFDGQAWRDHIAVYTPTRTVEWKRWNEKDKEEMTQEEFATWIEDNMPDIATVEGFPSGSDMYAMAVEFEANRELRFKSKLNLQSGASTLIFVNEDTAATEKKMTVFNRFCLGLPVFLRGSPYKLEARLKYRANGGSLAFWYELIRPDRVFRAAVEGEFDEISKQIQVTALSGTPGLHIT